MIRTNFQGGFGLSIDGTVLCNFMPEFTRLYRWADGPRLGEPAFVHIRLLTAQTFYEHLVPAKELKTLRFLSCHPDLILYHKTYHDHIATYLGKALSQKILEPSGYAFCSTGLQQVEGLPVFVAGDRLIGGDGPDVAFTTEVSQFHLPQTEISASDTVEDLPNRLNAICPSVSIPVFAFGILSSLQSLVLDCGIPLTSVLYLAGASGLGKTETVKRFFALYDFAATNRPARITEAGSTLAGFRKDLRLARDLPVLLDDLCISTGRSTQRKRQELGSQVLHEATNRSAIRTHAGDHNHIPSSSAGLAITAEFPMDTISDVSRCLIIRLNQPMTGGRPDDRKVAAGALGHFLAWFVNRYGHEKRRLSQLYAQESDGLDRLGTGLFCLHWAFELFLRFALAVGGLSEKGYRQSVQFFEAILQNMKTRQQQLLDSIDAKIPKGSIPELVCAALEKQALPLVTKRKRLNGRQGLVKGDDLFIPPNILEQFLTAQDGYQTLTRNKMGRGLKAAGLLVLHESDRSNTVKVGEGLPRMYHIRLDVLRNITKTHMSK